MMHHLRQIEKAHPLKKGTSSGVQRIHLSGNPATHVTGPMALRPTLSRGLPFSQQY